MNLLFLGAAFGQNPAPEFTRAVPVGFYRAPESFTKSPVKLEQFSVVGLPASVRSIEMDRGPRRVLLLLDRSGSMKNDRRLGGWEWATRLAKDFLSQMHPEDQVSLHVFSSKRIQVMEFTSDFAAVASEIDGLAPAATPEAKKSTGWGTYLYNELPALLQSFGKDCRFGDSILIVSDGDFAQGSQKIHRALAAAGVRVFLLLSTLPDIFGNQYKFWQTATVSQLRIAKYSRFNAAGLDFSAQISWDTGGDIFDPWKDVTVHPGGIDDFSNDNLFPRTARAAYYVVKNVFRFEIQLSAPVDKMKRFEIQFMDAHGKPVKNLMLVYPRYLGPAHAAP